MVYLPNPRPNSGEPPTLEWIRSNVEVYGECWVWLGSKDEKGYGRVHCPGYRRVHRLAYELAIGPVPGGLMLDHGCRNTSCCNPEHLEPVTNQENVRRGNSLKYVDGKCPAHPSARLYKRRYGHQCAECTRIRESSPERMAKRAQYEANRSATPERREQHRAACARYNERKRLQRLAAKESA